MSVKLESLEKNFVSLEIEVPVDKVDKAYEEAAKKASQQVSIPGFRKGKVPLQILEQNVGIQNLLTDAIEEVIPPSYEEAIKESGIEPIAQPDIEMVQAEKGKSLIYKAKVEVKPELKLGEYKGLEVEKKVAEVKKEQIDHEIETMRNRYAKVEEVDDASLEKGDVAVLDFEGFVDGEAFAGGKAENHSLEIGSNSFIPGFEDGMIGMVVGEEKDVAVTFPEEYHSEELAGKEAVFKVNLKSIKRKFLAEVDDEFAKDVSEFDTLEELRADIESKMKKATEEQSASAMRMALLEKAAENAEVDVPTAMIDSKIDSYISDLEQRLGQQGATIDQYLQFSGTDMDKVREEYRPRAEVQVRIDLTLEKLVEEEKIEISEDEIEKELDHMASVYGQDKENLRTYFKAQGNMNMIEKSLAFDKAVSLIEEEAKITEVSAE